MLFESTNIYKLNAWHNRPWSSESRQIALDKLGLNWDENQDGGDGHRPINSCSTTTTMTASNTTNATASAAATFSFCSAYFSTVTPNSVCIQGRHSRECHSRFIKAECNQHSMKMFTHNRHLSDTSTSSCCETLTRNISRVYLVFLTGRRCRVNDVLKDP